MDFSPDGKRALTATEDGTTQFWDAQRGKSLGPPRRDQSSISAIALSPDGRMIITGSAHKAAQLWDAETGRPLGLPLPHESEVLRAAFSLNGRFLLTSGYKDARLWNAATGQPLGRPIDQPRGLAVAPDGKTVLVNNRFLGVTQYEIETGKAVGPAFERAKHGTFSPDGGTVATSDWSDGIVHLWNVAPVAGDPARIILWAQVLTGMELDETGVARILDFESRRERRRQLEKLGGPPWP
jgi:WD40 repeat protein